jgi:16S rRNA (guanine966-N2)-methyltransferase
MRITGGEARGRTLHFPAASKQRPTSDFLREALFNLLGQLQGKTFLDLYAGSGSVGIEAASRGAREVVFIEKDKKIAAVIRRNIVTCGFNEGHRIIALDISAGLHDLFINKDKFNIVFADPPYGRGFVEKTIKLLTDNPVQTKESVIVFQHSVREALNSFLDKKTVLIDQRKYGDNVLSFLRMEKI